MRIPTFQVRRNSIATPLSRRAFLWAGALLALLCCGTVLADDPPARVARLSVLQGEVSFAPAGQDSWSDIDINRPLATGDRLLSGENSRVEMQFGGASMRLSANTATSILALDEQTAQVEISQGTLNLDVRHLDDGETYEIDTPTVALVIGTTGEYRIDIDNDDGSATVSVYSGAATVYGSGGSQYALNGRQSYRFGDAALTDVAAMSLAEPDDFDRWCFERDDAESRVESQGYVSADVVGASDLDAYGEWQAVGSYGPVWFPNTVAVGWAPYRYGHWAWIAPWGWTWIDNAPWGFAPFHYGRWVYVNNGWGWMPGPSHMRPVYAPALVAFYGGSHQGVSVGSGGGPVGWCPLGPGEVYVPPYRVTHNYFTNVNVTNVTNINHTTINNYYNNNGSGNRGANIDYRYHKLPGAMTVVSHDSFVHARPVNSARIQVDAAALSHANVLSAPAVQPVPQSLGLRTSPHARVLPAPETLFRRPLANRGDRVEQPVPPNMPSIRTQPQQMPVLRTESPASRPGLEAAAPAAREPLRTGEMPPSRFAPRGMNNPAGSESVEPPRARTGARPGHAPAYTTRPEVRSEGTAQVGRPSAPVQQQRPQVVERRPEVIPPAPQRAVRPEMQRPSPPVQRERPAPRERPPAEREPERRERP
ncbi:MAG: DUF6600 domain-containing protein [Stenotrophobium sp.]